MTPMPPFPVPLPTRLPWKLLRIAACSSTSGGTGGGAGCAQPWTLPNTLGADVLHHGCLALQNPSGVYDGTWDVGEQRCVTGSDASEWGVCSPDCVARGPS